MGILVLDYVMGFIKRIERKRKIQIPYILRHDGKWIIENNKLLRSTTVLEECDVLLLIIRMFL